MSKPLKVHAIAFEAATEAINLVCGVSNPLRSLADQVVRSASSVPANLAEGHGRFGKDRIYHYRVAYGSAKEVEVHLQILLQAGRIDRIKAKQVLDLFDRVRAMTWKLIHRKRE